MREAIEAVLDAIRPGLERDGGGVEVVDVSEAGVVTLRALGGCFCCPVSLMTLRAGVENTLRERVPAVSKVVFVRG